MAQAPSQVQNPITEEAFTADRQRMFAGFVSATIFHIIAAIVILALMGLFLV